MEEAYELAREIEERAGIRLDRETIESSAKHITSNASGRKEEDRHRHHRRRRSDRNQDLGDTKQRQHEQDSEYRDLDYIDDPIAKIYAPQAVIREIEKLGSWNKDLQAKMLADERTIRKCNDKIADLKEQLNDESAETMKLVTERESLKLQIEDYKRKFFAVLLMSGLSEKDVTHFFQKNPRANEITDEMIHIKQEIKKYENRDKEDKYELMNPVILSKRIDQLEQWNRELNAASHDRIKALKNEIHVLKEEHYKVLDNMHGRIERMAKRLSENNRVLHLTLSDNLKLNDARTEIEATFNKERKKLLEYLKSNDLDQSNLVDGPKNLVENAQVDASTIKKLQSLLSRTQNDLIRRETEIESFRAEFLKMEKKVSRAEMETEEFKKLYEETVRKMNESNEALIQRAEKIDARRKLEATGFRNDVKELARFMADLQKKMNYCLSVRLEKKMTGDLSDSEMFRSTLRALSLDDNSKKNIVNKVRAKYRRMEEEKDREKQRGHSTPTEILFSRQSSQLPKTKPTILKSNSTKMKYEPSSLIKLKLCKLSSGKVKSMKDRPKWVDITTKDYSSKPKDGTSRDSRKAKDAKGKGSAESQVAPKMKSESCQCNEMELNYDWDGMKWMDGDVEELIELINAPGALPRPPWRGGPEYRPATVGSADKSKRTMSSTQNDENNNTISELQKQLRHASKRLDEINRGTKRSRRHTTTIRRIGTAPTATLRK